MSALGYWLVKSEPDVFSIDDMEKAKTTGWEGVRNFQARNFIREMKRGDRAFFYHSSVSPSAIVGEVEIVREAYPDPAQFELRSEYYDPKSEPQNPKWWRVDVRFLRKFRKPLTIDEIKQEPKLKGMILLKNSRLSVQPVKPDEWWLILGRCQ